MTWPGLFPSLFPGQISVETELPIRNACRLIRGPFWLEGHQSIIPNCLTCTNTHTLTNTRFTGSVALLLPDVYEITLNILGRQAHCYAQNPEHKQTLKQAFQTVSLLYLIQQASHFQNVLLIRWKFHPPCVCVCVCSRCAVRATPFQIPFCVGGID